MSEAKFTKTKDAAPVPMNPWRIVALRGGSGQFIRRRGGWGRRIEGW